MCPKKWENMEACDIQVGTPRTALLKWRRTLLLWRLEDRVELSSYFCLPMFWSLKHQLIVQGTPLWPDVLWRSARWTVRLSWPGVLRSRSVDFSMRWWRWLSHPAPVGNYSLVTWIYLDSGIRKWDKPIGDHKLEIEIWKEHKTTVKSWSWDKLATLNCRIWCVIAG